MTTQIIKYKKLFTIIFAALFIVQVFLLSGVNLLGGKLTTVDKDVTSYRVGLQTAFIKNTVRGQQRRQLDAIRQGWIQYIQTHPLEQPLKKDNKGNIIYANAEGKIVAYNPNTMERVRTPNYTFSLKDLNGNVLLENARPQWDIEIVKRIISIIATPVKAFGPTGDIIVFDSYTGEMLLDNSEDCKDTPEVLGADGKRYITLDYKHPNNQNPELTKQVVERELMWRKDTDENTGMVYFFSEPTDMGANANDFQLYPLGMYNREFQEKIILPYESLGTDGENAQITIVLGAQEKEIYSSYKALENTYNIEAATVLGQLKALIIFPSVSIILSVISSLIAIFTLVLFKNIKHLQA